MLESALRITLSVDGRRVGYQSIPAYHDSRTTKKSLIEEAKQHMLENGASSVKLNSDGLAAWKR